MQSLPHRGQRQPPPEVDLDACDEALPIRRDSGEVERRLGRILGANPRLTRFVPFIEHDGTIERSKLEAAPSRGFCTHGRIGTSTRVIVRSGHLERLAEHDAGLASCQPDETGGPIDQGAFGTLCGGTGAHRVDRDRDG